MSAPLTVDTELARGITAAAATLGLTGQEVVNIALRSAVEQVRRTGEITALAAPAPSKCTVSPPSKPLPILARALARKFAVIAEVLDMHPQHFVNSVIKSMVDDFFDPAQGLLAGYATHAVQYVSPEDERAVKNRVAAFNRRRRALSRRKSTMESGVEA